MTARSWVDGDVPDLNSPLRLKPGAWVELRTCCLLFFLVGNQFRSSYLGKERKGHEKGIWGGTDDFGNLL